MKACETAAAKEATPSLTAKESSFACNLLDWGGWHNDGGPPLSRRGRFSAPRPIFSTGARPWSGE